MKSRADKGGERSPGAIIRDLRAEVKEEHDWRMRLHGELKDLKETNERLNGTRVALYEGYIQERTDLVGRIQRIDMRIYALGFRPPGNSGEKQ